MVEITAVLYASVIASLGVLVSAMAIILKAKEPQDEIDARSGRSNKV